jgi:hypothetical protein
MKGGNYGTNGTDLDKNNIIKPTFNTLEDGCKAFEAYHADLVELFLSHCEVTWQGTILKDTMPIIICLAEVIREVWPNPPLSLNDVQSMINSMLERQAKSTDKLLRRFIEEWDGKKLDTTSINPSSTSCDVSFAQTNTQTSGASVGGATMPNPSAQLMNHFNSRTTIVGSTPNFGMPQQTMANMFGQGYTQTTPCFSMPIFTSAPFTPEGNNRTYAHASVNNQAPYSTVAYIDPIPLPSSSLGFLPNHAYHNAS